MKNKTSTFQIKMKKNAGTKKTKLLDKKYI